MLKTRWIMLGVILLIAVAALAYATGSQKVSLKSIPSQPAEEQTSPTTNPSPAPSPQPPLYCGVHKGQVGFLQRVKDEQSTIEWVCNFADAVCTAKANGVWEQCTFPKPWPPNVAQTILDDPPAAFIILKD